VWDGGRLLLMGFIPEARWYLADLVVAISVGKRKKVAVHVNTVLFRADSPSEAYEGALALGRQEELRYENAKGSIQILRAWRPQRHSR
jgi:hypothetical protein